jgi:hypothetical protein
MTRQTRTVVRLAALIAGGGVALASTLWLFACDSREPAHIPEVREMGNSPGIPDSSPDHIGDSTQMVPRTVESSASNSVIYVRPEEVPKK